MEVTKRSVKDFLLPESKFQETVETPECNGINFQASLKFFQEQFVTSGSDLQSPSFQSTREEALNGQRKSEFRSMPIQIPTVDTILESVRVLRAIQKSEQERCSLSSTSPTLKQTLDFSEEETFTNLEASYPHSENEPCSFWPSISLGNPQQTHTNNLSTFETHFEDSQTKEDKTKSYSNDEKEHVKQHYLSQEGLDLISPCVRTNSLELIEEGTTNFEQCKIEGNEVKLVKKQKFKNKTRPIDVTDSLKNDLLLDESLVKDNSANVVTKGKTENQISALPRNFTEANSYNFLFESNSCHSLDTFFQSSLESNTVLGELKDTGSEKLNFLECNDYNKPEKLQEIEEKKCDSSENISGPPEIIRKEKYISHDEETSLLSYSEYEVDIKEKMNSHLEFSDHSCSSKLNVSQDKSFDKGESSVTAKQSSTDLLSITDSLYSLEENPEYQVMTTVKNKFEEKLFVLSRGTFCEYPEDYYVIVIEDSILKISKNSHVLVSLNMKYGRISIRMESILEIDNRMGRWVHIRCDNDVMSVKNEIESHCLKHWQTDCIQLVHYPLKSHQNVVIIDLGSCSTRAGILMDQPTLPSLFFPTICAADKQTGTCIYGMEALTPEVRKHSVISFPVRPSNKITKHTIDIHLLGGLFKKIFAHLKVHPAEYIVQICLPRSLSLNTQTALVKLVLEDLKVKAVCLTSQALLTLYAHEVNTAIAVNIGEQLDVLPVVDGFIVEKGVTRFPHGGQRLIHHMNQSLAEKRITLSNDIDSFVVQSIIKNLAYVAEDYNSEMEKASRYRNIIQKTVTLQLDASSCKTIALEEARFKVPEGLFNPGLWGLDSPGIHHLVHKAITATNVDARKRIAENIYVSGGVTMLPGFAERLNKELAKLSKPKIAPKVTASNYRYHCTFIGACKFAKLEVFPQVCVNLGEYSQNSTLALKKWALF